MQNKGAIKLFSVLFFLVCVYHLSFTFFVKSVEGDAKEFANSKQTELIAKQIAGNDDEKYRFVLDSIKVVKENYYLDSISNLDIYNLLVRKYTYKECKERELNLGLDLKGGMNVTLEVSVPEIIDALSGNNQDSTYRKALVQAIREQKNSQQDFVTLFAKTFSEVKKPGERLSAIFQTGLRDRVNFNSTDEQVVVEIRKETEGAIDRAFQVLRTRIDRFGVAQPNIQKAQMAGRILIELPGIKDPSRVRKLLQGTAKLEFWTTYEFKEVYQYLEDANKRLRTTSEAKEDTTKATTVAAAPKTDTAKVSLVEKAKTDTAKTTGNSISKSADQDPLYTYLRPAFVKDDKGNWYPGEGPVVGYADVKDTARINNMLAKIKHIFPRNLQLSWAVKTVKDNESILQLYALKGTGREGAPVLEGDVISSARQDFDQKGGNEILMQMTSEGAKKWKMVTADNVGKSIAIVLDGYVYSAPNVREEIPNGMSSISGNFTLEEANDLANVLGAGKLPAPVNIVEEAVVGPSLGKKAIDAGLLSFIGAFIIILIFMSWYYNVGGSVSVVALIVNMFFLFGVMASMQAVLTLPGIAGIILTIGMAVDANVIINERIKEEIRAGKGLRLAIDDGYKHSYSAIIDGQMTTIITGIALYIFGSGPIKGFATTLIIGILISLFTSIFITRLIFIWMLDKEKNIPFSNKITGKLFTDIHIDFIGLRKYFYAISIAVTVIGATALLTRGLHAGIDFAGGRTYVVRFDQDVKTHEIAEALKGQFNKISPEVKVFGSNDQVKITTSYLIDDKSHATDSILEHKLYTGVKGFYKKSISIEEFLAGNDKKMAGMLSTQKVGPTIADDLRQQAWWAVFISLIGIFIYIAIRFKKWTFGMGGLIALAHDAFIVASMYALFYNILPFDLQVDQHFIAAILTIIGYSINDSVIIFDRIREYIKLHPKRNLRENMNEAIGSTLGRTFNTVLTVLLVLLILFVFGGEFIRGFTFVLFIGVAFGSYSSIFVSAAIAYDITEWREKKKSLK